MAFSEVFPDEVLWSEMKKRLSAAMPDRWFDFLAVDCESKQPVKSMGRNRIVQREYFRE
jgi:hypothetical protein